MAGLGHAEEALLEFRLGVSTSVAWLVDGISMCVQHWGMLIPLFRYTPCFSDIL